MNLTLYSIKQLKQESNNNLFKKVCSYVINEWNNYEDKKHIFTDVLNFGCQTGIVPELVYYTDTTAFYRKHKEEINDLLYKTMFSIGTYDPVNLFGEKWDKEDPLCKDDFNQNLLAWFGFEETLRQLAYNFKELENYI